MDLSNRVAVVAGGGRGIRTPIGVRLAEAGADVVVSSRKLPEVERVAEEP